MHRRSQCSGKAVCLHGLGGCAVRASGSHTLSPYLIKAENNKLWSAWHLPGLNAHMDMANIKSGRVARRGDGLCIRNGPWRWTFCSCWLSLFFLLTPLFWLSCLFFFLFFTFSFFLIFNRSTYHIKVPVPFFFLHPTLPPSFPTLTYHSTLKKGHTQTSKSGVMWSSVPVSVVGWMSMSKYQKNNSSHDILFGLD